MSVEQKNDIADEIAKLAENSKVEELSKKVTEVSSELAKRCHPLLRLLLQQSVPRNSL